MQHHSRVGRAPRGLEVHDPAALAYQVDDAHQLGQAVPGEILLDRYFDPFRALLKGNGRVPQIGFDEGEGTGFGVFFLVPPVHGFRQVGVWVKGDSSWGRIYWGLTDAKGERWCSSAAFDGGDWGNQSFIDFDGWCFVTFPLTNESPFTHVEPGLAQGQWIHDGDGKLDYPLKLSGLFVQTHRQSVNVTKMEPVKQPLRLRRCKRDWGTMISLAESRVLKTDTFASAPT